jgi:hypothetical protein
MIRLEGTTALPESFWTRPRAIGSDSCAWEKIGVAGVFCYDFLPFHTEFPSVLDGFLQFEFCSSSSILSPSLTLRATKFQHSLAETGSFQLSKDF